MVGSEMLHASTTLSRLGADYGALSVLIQFAS
jgi:hypothetical protein